MLKVEVGFSVHIPDNVSREEIREWLMYNLGATPHIRINNPLSETDLQAIANTVTISAPR